MRFRRYKSTSEMGAVMWNRDEVTRERLEVRRKHLNPWTQLRPFWMSSSIGKTRDFTDEEILNWARGDVDLELLHELEALQEEMRQKDPNYQREVARWMTSGESAIGGDWSESGGG